MSEEDAAQAQRRFHVVSTLEEAARDADLVIEAIIEKQTAKEELFRSLDKLVREDTILATNSSNMVSSLFADCIHNPARLANLHYFNPPLHMKLVEIVRKHFDLRPAGIIKMLDLRRPIYKQTAAYGHFGRELPEFTWERTDRADALREACGLK